MPLTSAERVRQHRDKLKQDPIKFEEYKNKHAALVKSKTKKVSDLSEAEKEKQREKWRNQKRKQKIKKENRSASCVPPLQTPEPIVSIEIKRRNTKISEKV